METDHRRMTALELDKAAASLLPTAPPLPPMRVTDMLSYFADSTRELQADLWTLRDAVDAHLTGSDHAAAVVALAELVELYADATSAVRKLATELRISLPGH